MRKASWIMVLCALGACSGDKRPAPAASSEPAKKEAEVVASAPAAPAPTGSIEGIVVLVEGAELPTLGDPKKTSKLAITDPPKPCSPVSAKDSLLVKRDAATGGLSDIHIAITGMKEIAPASPVTRELRLENCRLDRPLLAARVGDSLRITNASGAPLLPSMAGDSFMEAILAGASRTIELKRVGADRLVCRFGAFCGQTDVLVTGHSLFAVSDTSGNYKIDKVPLDQAITVHAWHPLFEESQQTITLSKDAPTAKITLTLKPAVRVEAKGLSTPPPAKPKPGEVPVH